MALQDEQWQWDDGDAVASTSESLEQDIDNDLMLATGADSAREAHELFVGRPRLSEGRGEESVQLQFKAPRSMADFVDEQRKRSGMRNKSEYLRMLVEQEMKHQGHRMQAA
ncbi:hypothetical protein [Bifidobacterium crudilactis]|uniref:hypothetical protein n=1 Tax=Bifidobacterium crudilactis TaxID=327277 RepID=UPI0026477766|nr:hypothetical protein [Bifidobacterium crudilactis]MDN5973329.1 hypothetical protein [Bifidobacterium crudilactis]MDN6522913.1 hypothetical protein [Bifidobacterium crudilactis]MDN6622703.1 hypothetical protein [Bifidobacterium crudilactis]MDN6655057.1 hypothetical protein [Bifidobacterium crudilactis]MDN6683693.1 hypothetical protein [Bifidobacterium crudilactis]